MPPPRRRYTSPHAGGVGNIELTGVPAPRVSAGPYAKHANWPSVEVEFATAVTAIDAAVGRVVDTVVATNQGNNTVIFFASDNGAHQEGGHDHQFFNSSGYLNGYKRCIFDGGHKTAFIVRWDGHITPGRSTHLISFCDFLPTAAELAGVPASALPPRIDGLSFVPTLLGKDQDQPPFVCEYLRADCGSPMWPCWLRAACVHTY
jgi:arylsulfatase A-like enzyme